MEMILNLTTRILPPGFIFRTGFGIPRVRTGSTKIIDTFLSTSKSPEQRRGNRADLPTYSFAIRKRKATLV
jgi:hypothetical protein